MSDQAKPGAALIEALDAREERKANANAARNRARERMFVRDSEMTADEHEAVQPDLKAAMYARNPHFLGS